MNSSSMKAFNMDKPHIYCAGPLFNQSEREEMTQLADVLQEAGYSVYLPHRDGMEFRLILDVLVDRKWSPPVAAYFLHAAIFALDVYQAAVLCEGMVWNLNGRTPDEGAVSEAAIAWTLGKPIVGYKDDVRSLIAGRDNPLVVGLVDFETVDDMDLIPERLEDAFSQSHFPVRSMEDFPPRLKTAAQDGERLWKSMQKSTAQFNNELIADVVMELFAPNSV